MATGQWKRERGREDKHGRRSGVRDTSKEDMRGYGKIVYEASYLKSDDRTLRGFSPNHIIWPARDLGRGETIRHVVMQCPSYKRKTDDMFNEILTGAG